MDGHGSEAMRRWLLPSYLYQSLRTGTPEIIGEP
jgi:hypothetical protein